MLALPLPSLTLVLALAHAQGEGVPGQELRQVELLGQQGRYREAAREAARLTRQHKQSSEAWMALAECHLQDGWPLRKDLRAETAALKALELGGRRPGALRALALAYYRQTKFEECLDIVAEVVDSMPPQGSPDLQAELLAMRADVLLRRDALVGPARRRAEADLERALQLDPQGAEARMTRAELRIEQRDYAGAWDDLQVALRRLPGNRQVHHQLQISALRLGRRDDARRHFEIWSLLHRLSDSVARTSAPSPGERLGILRRLREINPDDVSRRLELGWLELEAGQLDRARAECDELLRQRPNWSAVMSLSEGIRAREQGD